MSDAATPELNDCGCCEGVEDQTPVIIDNPPGLSALAYRVGTHSRFKQSMQVDLTRRLKPLRDLKTRRDDDPTIGLIDAWATVLDVLTFYQERIANEGYLRTGTERRSLLELASSIGYELRPGVAASTYLMFTMETAEDAPRAGDRQRRDKGAERSRTGPAGANLRDDRGDQRASGVE